MTPESQIILFLSVLLLIITGLFGVVAYHVYKLTIRQQLMGEVIDAMIEEIKSINNDG